MVLILFRNINTGKVLIIIFFKISLFIPISNFFKLLNYILKSVKEKGVLDNKCSGTSNKGNTGLLFSLGTKGV